MIIAFFVAATLLLLVLTAAACAFEWLIGGVDALLVYTISRKPQPHPNRRSILPWVLGLLTFASFCATLRAVFQ